MQARAFVKSAMGGGNAASAAAFADAAASEAATDVAGAPSAVSPACLPSLTRWAASRQYKHIIMPQHFFPAKGPTAPRSQPRRTSTSYCDCFQYWCYFAAGMEAVAKALASAVAGDADCAGLDAAVDDGTNSGSGRRKRCRIPGAMGMRVTCHGLAELSLTCRNVQRLRCTILFMTSPYPPMTVC